MELEIIARYFERHQGADSFEGFDLYVALGLADDPGAERQPKPVVLGIGGKEGLEDA